MHTCPCSHVKTFSRRCGTRFSLRRRRFRSRATEEVERSVADEYVGPSLSRALEHVPNVEDRRRAVEPYPLLTSERGQVPWDPSLDKDDTMPPAPARDPTPEDLKAREYKQVMAKLQQEAIERKLDEEFEKRIVPLDMSDDVRVVHKRGAPEEQKVWTEEEELEFINCIPGMDITVLAQHSRADYPSIRERFLETYNLEDMWDPTCAVDPRMFANPNSRHFEKLIRYELEHLGDWLDENDGRFIEDDMELEIESTLASDFSGLEEDDYDRGTTGGSWNKGAKRGLEEAEDVQDETEEGSESMEE